MTSALTPRISLYLDAIRFLAAFTVFLSHYGRHVISGGLFYQFLNLGEGAVDIFFVLSGFVIADVVGTREHDARTYALHRIARIASVCLPALAATLLFDTIGSHINPALYAKAFPSLAENAWLHYAAAALFLHQAWFLVLTPGSNGPFWSMGFEVWYYVIFGVAIFARTPWRWPLAALILCAIGPKVAILFPLWLLGVATQRACLRPPAPRLAAIPLLLAPLLAVAYFHGYPRIDFAPYEPLRLDASLLGAVNDYIIGGAFALHLLGVRALAPSFPALPARIAAAIRWLAGCTFGLYLFHFPILYCIAATMPLPVDSIAGRLTTFFGSLALALTLARLTESRKRQWRSFAARLLPA